MTTGSWIFSFSLVILSWSALQTVVMLFTDTAPGAIALFPANDFMAHLPDDVSVVGTGVNRISVRSGAADLGPKLYSAGALIVLPAGLPECLPL